MFYTALIKKSMKKLYTSNELQKMKWYTSMKLQRLQNPYFSIKGSIKKKTLTLLSEMFINRRNSKFSYFKNMLPALRISL